MGIDKKIGVCHLISGDLWAGAEVQMYTVMEALRDCPEFELMAVTLNEGTLADKLREIGVRVAVFEESRLRFSQIRRNLQGFLEQNKPAILHSHRYKENILGGLAKRSGKVKYLVQTVHGMGEPFRGIKQLRSQAYSLINTYVTMRYFDRIIAVSDDIHRKLLRYISPDTIVTIHNAIDPDALIPTRNAESVRAEFGIGKEAPVIGSVGRMVPVKRFDLFLKMARVIISSRPDIRFLLVGDGPMRGELENLAGGLGLEENVIFTGFRHDVTDLINCLDIFALTSYHEGIPMALLEAMAMKKIVVSTAVGGIPEVIEDGVSGNLIYGNEAGELAALCLRILENRNMQLNLAMAARAQIEREFSIKTLRDRVRGLYVNLTTDK
jgi:glycosyltransferase involved in cell wall biosynthesis